MTTKTTSLSITRASATLSFPQVIGQILKYALLIILAISFILPFYWMVTSAIKDDPQVYTVPPIWIPNPAHWRNFWDAWTLYDYNLYLLNTVFRYAIPATLGMTLSSAFVAYGFARIRWRWREFFFALLLATMMIPGQVTVVPIFIVFKHLGWIDSYRPLVIPAFFGGAWNIFLMRQFFRSIPDELSEAAYIDGASEFTVFFRVILPLSKPALTVVALFSFMGAWNDYFGPLIYISHRENFPIALAIHQLRASYETVGTNPMIYPYLMAVSTIVTIPILIMYFFAQRTFIEQISLTGLKG
ncbi:MAG: carbohydrate ABC transporter permease [Anaerolineae bacterium]|nr:carbohydrate ABC transporter permease [Anaerolineae bacterium]